MCPKMRPFNYSQLLEFHSKNLLPAYNRKAFCLQVFEIDTKNQVIQPTIYTFTIHKCIDICQMLAT